MRLANLRLLRGLPTSFYLLLVVALIALLCCPLPAAYAQDDVVKITDSKGNSLFDGSIDVNDLEADGVTMYVYDPEQRIKGTWLNVYDENGNAVTGLFASLSTSIEWNDDHTESTTVSKIKLKSGALQAGKTYTWVVKAYSGSSSSSTFVGTYSFTMSTKADEKKDDPGNGGSTAPDKGDKPSGGSDDSGSGGSSNSDSGSTSKGSGGSNAGGLVIVTPTKKSGEQPSANSGSAKKKSSGSSTGSGDSTAQGSSDDATSKAAATKKSKKVSAGTSLSSLGSVYALSSQSPDEQPVQQQVAPLVPQQAVVTGIPWLAAFIVLVLALSAPVSAGGRVLSFSHGLRAPSRLGAVTKKRRRKHGRGDSRDASGT